MHTWNRKALYNGITNQASTSPKRVPTDHARKTMNKNEQKKTLDSKTYGEWRSTWGEFDVDPGEDESYGKKVIKVKSIKIYGCKYVAAKDLYKNPPGNSNVEVVHGGERLFGRISLLFVAHSGGDVWLLFRPFSTLNCWDQPKSPYKDLPQLNTRLLYSNKFDQGIVVHQSRIVGHLALLENKEGTFGVTRPTVSAVSLGRVVCTTFSFLIPFISYSIVHT